MLPIAFGFTVYSSITQAKRGGLIPFPAPSDKAVGGRAVVAVGDDDLIAIPNTSSGGRPATGALLIRNSWGAAWGDDGDGWLPYEYLLRGQATH